MGEAWNPFDPAADQTKKGWLTAILELGAWFGALMSGVIAEYFSRKYGIIIATVVFVIGVLIQTAAISAAGHHATLAGRFITGMGVGSLSMIVPIVSCSRLPQSWSTCLGGLLTPSLFSTTQRWRHRMLPPSRTSMRPLTEHL